MIRVNHRGTGGGTGAATRVDGGRDTSIAINAPAVVGASTTGTIANCGTDLGGTDLGGEYRARAVDLSPSHSGSARMQPRVRPGRTRRSAGKIPPGVGRRDPGRGTSGERPPLQAVEGSPGRLGPDAPCVAHGATAPNPGDAGRAAPEPEDGPGGGQRDARPMRDGNVAEA